jgi:hypothetical protein
MVSTDTASSCSLALNTTSLGPLVRVAPNELMTDDCEVLRKMSAVRSPYTKSPWWYESFRWIPNEDSAFTMTNDVAHDERRAKIASAVGKTQALMFPSSILTGNLLSTQGRITSRWKGRWTLKSAA